MKAKKINGYFQIIDYDYEMSQLTKTYDSLLTQNSVDDGTINLINQKPEESRTDDDLQKLAKRNEIEEWFSNKQKNFDGYKDLEVVAYNDTIESYERLDPVFTEEDDKVVQTYNKVASKQLLNEIISNKEAELSSTDYIIIKSYEAKITMSDAPYTDEYLTQITTQRQEIRDKINELQELLKTAN